MKKTWLMKTFKEWSDDFVVKREIGMDEPGIDENYLNYGDYKPIENEKLLRRFDQFSKWVDIGDYVVVGIGQMTKFNMKIIARVISDYEFDANSNNYRHRRKVEIVKKFEEPIEVSKWGQTQRLESVALMILWMC